MDTYGLYRQGHVRLRELAGVVASWSPGSQVQVDALRGIAILLCAEFEAYLRSVLQDALDGIGADWDGLVPAQRRLVATHLAREAERIASEKENVANGTEAADRVADRIRKLGAWLDTPGRFARDVPDARLEDFHESKNVWKTVDKTLVLLRSDGMPYFDWLGSKGADQTALKDALQELVRLRNDAAHQLRIGLQPTTTQLRGYFRVTALLVRSIRAYVDATP